MRRRGIALLVLLISVAACARQMRTVEVTPDRPASIAELWRDPGDIARLDLFHGAGGADHAPSQTVFTFVAEDTSGYSPGFDVIDWNGLFAATGTPPELINRMQSVCAEGIKDPKVKERLDAAGAWRVSNTRHLSMATMDS